VPDVTVVWPSEVAKEAEIWRVLDLSGMTKSVRESRNFTRAGYVFMDGNLVASLRSRVEIGKRFLLELRFPNGKVISGTMFVINRTPSRTPRSQEDTTLYRKG
jgi:hypothetical protein